MLAADVVTCNRPMGEEQAVTLATLKASGEEPIDFRGSKADTVSLFRWLFPKVHRSNRERRPRLSNPGRAIAIGIALLGLNGTTAAVDLAPVAGEIRQTAQDVLSGANYQRELPHQRTEPASRGTDDPDDAKPAAPESVEDSLEAQRGLGDELEQPRGLGDVGKFLLWILVLVGGALLVFYLLNEVPRLVKQSRAKRDQRASRESHATPVELARPSDGGLLEEADRLARQGKYGEAIHALLLHSLEDLHKRLDVSLEPSLTSREILSKLSLREDAKFALARIVTLAELNYFGGRASTEREYQTCRADNRHLATVGNEAT
jgi:hypothetical protein